jgi:hypothetical protein
MILKLAAQSYEFEAAIVIISGDKFVVQHRFQ